ncbi:MAG: PepSY domain-containing protein [Clostridia bacterium]|nr:PepSY domain-containing protein [Clostridia bacterium]
MKKKIFTVSVSVVLILSVVLLGACVGGQPIKEENVNLNQAQASAPSVKNSEVVSVSPDEAINVALKHAGVARENAVMFGAPSLDEENGKRHYEVEFGYNGFKYDYEVAVDDGSILKAEKEAERVKVSAKESVSANSEVHVSKNNNNGYISVEAAKQKALDDAGVKAEDAVFLKAYYDSNDIVPHYEVKFKANGYEYEYEVKASDGSVLEKDVDKERNSGKTSSASKEYISQDKAKSTAFDHASVKAADVKFSKAELDRDDMVVHYDVEFVAGKYEYEYEINAETGKVIAFDKEFND